jgi:hypothetical protein
VATVVAIMDRPAPDSNTDVLVVADPDAARLLWVPRDLWCDGIGDRVNRAFGLGGHAGLVAALAEHGIEARHSVCLFPAAIVRAAEGVSVAIEVPERAEYWYPLEPLRPIEEGRKRIAFEPPVETLSGERIHQWVGARYRADGRHGSDLERIGRQQRLVTVLLTQGYDFGRALSSRDDVVISDPEAIRELSQVNATWRFETVSDLIPVRIDEMEVLWPDPPRPPGAEANERWVPPSNGGR